MAKIVHTAVLVPGSLDFDGATITFVAATPASDEETLLTGKEMIIAHNTTGGALTVTINSVNDPFGRTKDIAADSIPANSFKIYGPFSTTGWQQTDGNLYFEASASGIEFVVLKLALP